MTKVIRLQWSCWATNMPGVPGFGLRTSWKDLTRLGASTGVLVQGGRWRSQHRLYCVSISLFLLSILEDGPVAFLVPKMSQQNSWHHSLHVVHVPPEEMCSIHMYASWASICPNSGCSLLCIHLEQLIASVCVRMWLLTSACVCVHACVLHVCIVA